MIKGAAEEKPPKRIFVTGSLREPDAYVAAAKAIIRDWSWKAIRASRSRLAMADFNDISGLS